MKWNMSNMSISEVVFEMCVSSGTDLDLPSEILEVGTFEIVVRFLQSTKVVVYERGGDLIGELYCREEAAVV
jgi:hypothetical protein